MESDVELVINGAKRIERLLRDNLRAEGKGLRELVDSVRQQLDRKTIKDIRFVARLRNRFAHDEDKNELEDDERNRFEQAMEELASTLESKTVDDAWSDSCSYTPASSVQSNNGGFADISHAIFELLVSLAVYCVVGVVITGGLLFLLPLILPPLVSMVSTVVTWVVIGVLIMGVIACLFR